MTRADWEARELPEGRAPRKHRTRVRSRPMTRRTVAMLIALLALALVACGGAAEKSAPQMAGSPYQRARSPGAAQVTTDRKKTEDRDADGIPDPSDSVAPRSEFAAKAPPPPPAPAQGQPPGEKKPEPGKERSGPAAEGNEAPHETAMLILRAFQPILLPPLTLVTSEIVNVERAIRLALLVQLALQFDQTLAARVNRETSEIRHDPTSAKTFCDRSRCAAAAKEVSYEIAFIAAGFDDALKQGFGLLGGVAQ